MPWPKCNGFMVSERCTDFSLVFYAWRCINCGTILDTTILQNKRRPLMMIGELCAIKV